MERVYEELDDARAEIEKLKEDLKCRVELSENLKKAHNEQLIQIQEASSKIERQVQELNEKTDEISVVKQMCGDLQRSLNEKESIIKCQSSTNDKLKIDYNQKYQAWEDERRGLIVALDEANEKKIDQEQKIHEYMMETEGLKEILSVSQKKCSEAEKKAKASKELRERDEVLLKLEEENQQFEDQLKWKKEQFQHLEEAHKKLRDQFKESKKEWEREKSTLVDEICSLQASLDSQIRISKDLQNQLNMCNHALAHEESRRKHLEIELSEFTTRYENIFSDCQEAKSQLESFTTQRDREIAALRQALCTKETMYKEVEYQAGKLEQENKELLSSLKELQEAQIQVVGNSSSLAKLKNKLKSVEQIHKDCSANLKAKEAEWSSQLDNLTRQLNDYMSKLESKETRVTELDMELENCHSAILQLTQENEEVSIMLLVLKSEMNEAKLGETEVEMNIHDKENDEDVSLLKQQLELKGIALAKALKNIEEEREKAESVQKSKDLEMSLHDRERDEEVSLLKKQLELKSIALAKALSDVKEHEKAAYLQKSKVLELSLHDKERDEEISSLKKQLELKNIALDKALSDAKEEREKAASVQKSKELEMRLLHKERDEEVSLLQQQLELKSLALAKALTDAKEKCEKAASLQKSKEIAVKELDMELENCHSVIMQLKQQSEEASIMVLVLKSEINEVQLKLGKAEAEINHYKKEIDEVSFLKEQLELKNVALAKAQKEAKEEQKKAASLLKREGELRQVRDALNRVNSELAGKICEAHAIEFELWIWKSIAQRLKDDLEENQALRKEIEASLLAQVAAGETIKQVKDELAHVLEVKDSRIDALQQQILFLEQEIKPRDSDEATSELIETMTSLESEKESILRTMREKDKILEDLQKEIEWLEQESLKREFEGAVFTQISAEKTSDHERENLIRDVENKDQRIYGLLQLLRSLEEKFNDSLTSFSTELAQKQVEISLLHEAWENIAAAEILAQLEIEEKKLMIIELEDDICSVCQKLETHEKTLFYSKQQALEIEAELEEKQLEMKKFSNLMETKLRTSEALVDELKTEKRNLTVDVMNLSTERENLLSFIAALGDRINQFSSEDLQLMESLERILLSVDNNASSQVLKIGNEAPVLAKENVNTLLSPTTKNSRAIIEERSPFRELN